MKKIEYFSKQFFFSSYEKNVEISIVIALKQLILFILFFFSFCKQSYSLRHL